jgi:hypothetical protein
VGTKQKNDTLGNKWKLSVVGFFLHGPFWQRGVAVAGGDDGAPSGHNLLLIFFFS